MATPARLARRPDGDVAPAAAEGGSTSGLLFRLASYGAAAPLLGPLAAAVEQFRRRCTSLLCRGFTMKSSAPAFRHLLRPSTKEREKIVSTASMIACRIGRLLLQNTYVLGPGAVPWHNAWSHGWMLSEDPA